MNHFKVGTNIVKSGYHKLSEQLCNRSLRTALLPMFEFNKQEYSTLLTVNPRSVKTYDWNRAVADAEKIVGHPTTYFSLKCVLAQEFTDVAMHLRRLIGTDHPILRTVKRLAYHGKRNLQTRGLIVLLLSKAAGHTSSCSDSDAAQGRGITPRQQNLAEITEMIYTASLIHKGILNISPSTVPEKNYFDDLQFGNKISVLSGDYFLAHTCKGLSNLRNCKVVDLISKALGDFMQSEFLGEHDKLGNPLPYKGMSLANWEEKNFLCAGSLLANSCKSTLELAGHNENMQFKGFEFGKNVALAGQAYTDLQPFVEIRSHPPSGPFDLTSLPVTFHLEEHPETIDLLRNKIGDNVNNLDFKPFYESVMEGSGVDKAKNLLQKYCETAEIILTEFDQSAATKALSNIITALKL